jgi:tRNA uridine 5-carboxymethylaminomethyl modification enzyme
VNPRILERALAERVLGQPIEREYSLLDLLRRPNVSYRSLMEIPIAGAGVEDDCVAEQVEIQAKYQGYIERQRDEVRRRSTLDSTRLPANVDYSNVRGLSVEAQQTLNRFKPETIGQAARISGVTPAAISLLLVHLKRGLSKRNAEKKTA